MSQVAIFATKVAATFQLAPLRAMQNSTKTGRRPAPLVNVGTPKPVAESQLSVNFRVDLAYPPRCRE